MGNVDEIRETHITDMKVLHSLVVIGNAIGNVIVKEKQCSNNPFSQQKPTQIVISK